MHHEQRIYYLDVLRALAIFLVFIGHTILSYGPTPITAPLQYGGTGVDLFFLLSGWLIGSQLFAEHKKFGDIDITRFWLRRWMRTFPAYFAVLLFTLAQLYLTKDSVQNPIPYFTFTQNYFGGLPYFGVSWSLAVEEQFYLAIAPTIVLLSYIRNTWIQFSILISLLLLPLFFRLAGWYDSPQETHVRWDCCMTGVTLAFIYHRMPTVWQRLERQKTNLLCFGATAYVLFFYFRWYPPFDGYNDPSVLILAVVFGALVIYAVTTPVSKIRFGHTFVMHISTRSYSIYLLHPDALAVCRRLIPDVTLGLYFIIATIITLVAAEILYKAVEIPFMKMREHFDACKKPNLNYKKRCLLVEDNK